MPRIVTIKVIDNDVWVNLGPVFAPNLSGIQSVTVLTDEEIKQLKNRSIREAIQKLEDIIQ